MVSIYQFDSYKKFFTTWVSEQSNRGHGEYRRLALALRVSTTLVSQIFNGQKDLSLELACELADYLHLNENESEYLLLLVEYSKAGSEKLKTRFLKQIRNKQNEAKKLSNRLKEDHTLDEASKVIYFSSWVYPAIRILCDLPEYNSATEIAERLQLPRNHVQKCLDFMIQNNIVTEHDKILAIGPAHIYLPPTDSLSPRDHANWRSLSYQKMQIYNEDHFYYSGQYALSKEVLREIRALLPDFIENILKKVKPSPSETTCCINLDFFEF
jgi:plasmid maintenance system antidote protein VapI